MKFDELVFKYDVDNYDVYFIIVTDADENLKTTAFHIDYYVNDEILRNKYKNEKVVSYSILKNDDTQNMYISVMLLLEYQ